MMSHGMTLLALISSTDERWANALATLIAVHPIRPGKGQDDYIAVVLDAKYYHMELCAGAQDKGLQFPNGFADDDEDVIYAYTTVEAGMEQVNKERLQAALKPNKRARTKKATQQAGLMKLMTRQLRRKSPEGQNGRARAAEGSGRRLKQRSLTGNCPLQ